MIATIRGRLLSPLFATTVLHTLAGATMPPQASETELERIGTVADEALGPSSSARAVADVLVLPLLRALELRVALRRDLPDETRLIAGGTGPTAVPVIVRGWATELESGWRELVRDGIAADARWALACNGRELRIVDVQRTWARQTLNVDVAALGHDATVRRVVWVVANGRALSATPALLDTAVSLSAEHGVAVCRSLGSGVVNAVRNLYEALGAGPSRRVSRSTLLEQCLTVVYRILFLLFAEARGLVPVWHPLYRDQYSIGAMVTTLMSGQPGRGTWEAIKAISRLAHAGCATGDFTVTAFNSRLFSPQLTSGVDSRRIADDVMRRVVMELGTARIRESGVTRTRYEDLDVEQLGSVYEHVLEYQPGEQAGDLIRTRDTRKASGTFYTPRELAAALVEHTLEPLVSGRTSEEILRLRILDPAMGSGAFLVAACRYLARRLERALIDEGTWHAGEITSEDRVTLRRQIVQRCLYGVDINPVAVQLARLSLWLVALVRDKPLSFLDHHLVAGNSLVGATPAHLHRETAGARAARRQVADLPLFDLGHLETAVASAGNVRTQLTREPDDSAPQVRSKEIRLEALGQTKSTLTAWRRTLDLWCATWFWPDRNPPGRPAVADVLTNLTGGRAALSSRTLDQLLRCAGAAAESERFLHWPLAFPEVFQDDRGRESPSGGFDAVLGNPPWDMIRGDSGDDPTRDVRRTDAQRLTRFVRESGVYAGGATAHVNRYALFAERALQLTRRGGRIGLVLPGGILADAGAASLRARLFAAADVDAVVGLDNRGAIFPVHRSVRFVLLTATSGTPTQTIRCRFGLSRLDQLGDAWTSPKAIPLTRAFITRVSGEDDLGVPELLSTDDFRLVERITAEIPTLESAHGWHVRFGRELNATDDRTLMTPVDGQAGARRIVEGKMITPFRVDLDRSRLMLARNAVVRDNIARLPRLAYREVASATNRLTLIAAIVPAHAVTTHTAFCLKASLPLASQWVLCALLNSFVANYLVRLRVNTHVTATIMSRLRVPLVQSSSHAFARLHEMSVELADGKDAVESNPVYCRMQAEVASLYGLNTADFAHVLSTFPLIPLATREACLAAFR